MPRISYFYGIIVSMYSSDHPPPHFHARYGEMRQRSYRYWRTPGRGTPCTQGEEERMLTSTYKTEVVLRTLSSLRGHTESKRPVLVLTLKLFVTRL